MNWIRLRRFCRDPFIERTALGLLALLSALMALKSKLEVDAAPEIDRIDPSLLLWAARFYGVFFLFWFLSHMVFLLAAPRLVFDYNNKEQYLDASLKIHSSIEKNLTEQRDKYIQIWNEEINKSKPGQYLTIVLQSTALLSFLASLIFVFLLMRKPVLYVLGLAG
ncbi:hypothetical protein [Prosthecodimorpha staleyi]|uniref:Uncharacterized protein n=1 Tax=Prosthecodimorpha staleyi TaxID=2840188 RepID=A0A947GDY5_9HYPH|nr:hypothetical protein [Prosthecodimorpha staleyi]MBT9290796.1 hypothetical protein [Prosthecodimorpha staleyi]